MPTVIHSEGIVENGWHERRLQAASSVGRRNTSAEQRRPAAVRGTSRLHPQAGGEACKKICTSACRRLGLYQDGDPEAPSRGDHCDCGQGDDQRDPVRSSEWKERAACRPEALAEAGISPEIFFSGIARDSTKATNYCLSCPVVRDCRDYGTSKQLDGIWGGLYLVRGKPE